MWHLPRLRLLSFYRNLVDGLVWLELAFPVLRFRRFAHPPRLLLLRRQGGRLCGNQPVRRVHPTILH